MKVAKILKTRLTSLDQTINQVVLQRKIQHASSENLHFHEITHNKNLNVDVCAESLSAILQKFYLLATKNMNYSGTIITKILKINNTAIISIRDESKVQLSETNFGETQAEIESWHGTLSILTTPTDGNEIVIELPAMANYEAPSCILIDDDPLIRMTWEMKAKEKGVQLQTFASFDQVANLDDLAKQTIFYVDSEIGEQEKGEDIIRTLHTNGFKSLYMATGFEPDYIYEKCPELRGITKGVIGKEPLFAEAH